MRRLLLITLCAAALWFAAAALVGAMMIANGRASDADVLSFLLCVGQLCVLAGGIAFVRRGRS